MTGAQMLKVHSKRLKLKQNLLQSSSFQHSIKTILFAIFTTIAETWNKLFQASNKEVFNIFKHQNWIKQGTIIAKQICFFCFRQILLIWICSGLFQIITPCCFLRTLPLITLCSCKLPPSWPPLLDKQANKSILVNTTCLNIICKDFVACLQILNFVWFLSSFMVIPIWLVNFRNNFCTFNFLYKNLIFNFQDNLNSSSNNYSLQIYSELPIGIKRPRKQNFDSQQRKENHTMKKPNQRNNGYERHNISGIALDSIEFIFSRGAPLYF